MSSQLEQLVGYLDRDGVSEVVFGIGRPIAMRTKQGFQNLTARPLSADQFTTLVRGTAIANLIPQDDSVSDPVDLPVGRRRARIQIGRRDNEIVVTLSRIDAAAKAPATQPIQRIAERPTRAVTSSDRDELPSKRARTAPPVELATRPTPSPVEPPVELAARPTPSPVELATRPTPSPVASPVEVATRPTPSPVAPQKCADAPKPADAVMTFSLDDGLELGAGFGNSIDVDLDAPTNPPVSKAPPPPMLAMSIDIDLESHRPSPPIARPPSPRAETAPAAKPASPRAQTPPPVAQRSADVASAFASILRQARDRGASDLHIAGGRLTSIRTMGDLVPLDQHAQPLERDEADAILAPLMDEGARTQLDTVGYVDFALAAPDGGRLRANISKQQAGLKGTFRLALPAPATLAQLGLPVELAKVVAHHQGLVIVAGPSGHGKTTTLAALVDLINSTRPYHILTIEDPVEIVHPRKQAVISQREVGRHTSSFARGLKASLREDPDVIVIGELRDRESVEIALTAAETGHLVIATMSTPSAAKTIDRLIDMFPPEEHSQVRASVAGALRAIVAQRLLPKKGGGIIPAIELVTGVLPLAVLIRDDKLYQLPNLMQRGRAFGMIRFDESLLEHVRAGRITEDVALAAAENRKELTPALLPATQQVPLTTKTGLLSRLRRDGE